MKKSVFVAIGLIILLGLIWRIVKLVAQETGGLLQEKIRVEVIDTWPIENEEVFPMDVTLAKNQKYEFKIFDSENREVVFKRLDSNSFTDRETIYLKVASAAKPGKFRLQALSEGAVLRETEFWWGLIGINFSSWPLEVGVSNQIFISGCGDLTAWVDDLKQDLGLDGKCWHHFEYLVNNNKSTSLRVEIKDGKLVAEKKVKMIFDKNPRVRIKRSIQDGIMKIEYVGNIDKKELVDEVAQGASISEAGNAYLSTENGLNRIEWPIEAVMASGGASYKLGIWDPEAVVLLGPLSLKQKSEKKFFEETTHEKIDDWQEPNPWLVPGFLLDNQIKIDDQKENIEKDWIVTGRIGFRLNKRDNGFIVEYKDFASGGVASYTYDLETDLKDAPLLMGHYKVLIKNDELYVYEVNARFEEEKTMVDYQQIYP